MANMITAKYDIDGDQIIDPGYETPGTIVNWTASDSTVASSSGKVFANNSASPLTKTIAAGMPENYSIGLAQASTGTCTFAAGAGVTFIGATRATTAAGGTLVAFQTAADTYIIKAA